MVTRVTMANVGAHRTCRPVYEQYQATPYPIFLDATETRDVYSGMALSRTGEDTVKLYDGTSATARPFGLAVLDRNAVINDMEGLSSVPFSVWLGGPNAFFEIASPAFDATATWSVPTDGSRKLVYATSTGKLTTVVDGEPFAELIDVVSATKIIIRLWPFAANAVA